MRQRGRGGWEGRRGGRGSGRERGGRDTGAAGRGKGDASLNIALLDTQPQGEGAEGPGVRAISEGSLRPRAKPPTRDGGGVGAARDSGRGGRGAEC